MLEEVIVEETPTPPPPEDGELPPPEFVAFCYEFEILGDIFIHCYDTLEDCELGGELFEEGPGEASECEDVETVPPSALDCEVIRDEEEGEPLFASCGF